jgi:hypothetical protein
MVAAPIQDPTELAGRTVYDQLGNKLGKVQRVYAPGGGDEPKWVTVEVSLGLASDRLVFVPLARLKEEDGEVQVPYSTQRLRDAPEVEPGEELAPEDEDRLAGFYGLRDDVPVQDKPGSYAAQIPDGDEPPQPVE